MVLLPLYLDHLGGSRAAIGAVVAVARIGGLLSRPIVGWSLDTLGRRPTLVTGTVFIVVGMLMIYPVTSVGPLVYASRVVFGIGIGACFAGYFTFAADLIPTSRRTEGLALFGVSGLLPMALMPLAEGAGVAPPDIRWFLPLTGLIVAASLIALVRVPDRSRDGHHEPFRITNVAKAALQRPMWSVWLASIVFSAMVVMFLAFASVTAGRRGIAQPSALWLTYSLGAVAARVFGARLPDRVGTSNMVAPAIGVYVGAAILLANAQTLPPGAFGPPRWQCVQRQWPIAPRRGLPSSVRVS